MVGVQPSSTMPERPQQPPEKPDNRAERENRELRALLDATLHLQGELSLDIVLHNVVASATQLLDAQYGAASVIDHQGRIEQFVTHGIDAHLRERIGKPPQGVGLLGVPLREGEALRMDDLGADPRSAGFPSDHPPMRSLLAVPILCRSPHRGNLYLAEKKPRSFTEEDERTLRRFALGAAAAIDTTYLHLRSEALAIAEERLRLSREIHDGVAQVLAYVNTKAQAARELLDRDQKERAGAQLDQLAQAARGVYSDVREGILALRLQPSPKRSLEESIRDYVEHWQRRDATVVDLTIEGELSAGPEVQIQLIRIVQEALTNVRKHAGAQRVSLAFARRDGELEIGVVDDGCGFSTEEAASSDRRRSFGLDVMKERAEAIGGTFEIESAPGRGTTIRVRLPLAGATADSEGG